MDDEKFRKELLTRLDKIIALLSISCAVSNGSLEKAKADSAIRQILSSSHEGPGTASPPSLNDEMEEIHSVAMQRWNCKRDTEHQEVPADPF